MNSNTQPLSDERKPKRTNWWAAVWRGLVVDREAKHYYRIHSAIWLYLYLLIHAKRKTGLVFKRYATIAADMGVSERSVRNWMARLKRHRYIGLEKTGRTPVVRIQKWKAWGQLGASGKSSSSTGKSVTV